MTIGYAITFACALGLLIAYLILQRDKSIWFSVFYVCVTVVNLGYMLLSMAKSVEFAIFANDVVYLGSIFLSACMFFTILRLCGLEIKRTYVIISLTLAVLMFGIVATSGFLPWYYKSVDIERVNGATMLVKEYGVLHPVYLVYLLGYFTAMISAIIISVRKKKLGNPKFAGLIAGVVCGNILVWLFEKFVNWEFEFLSVTYIISEMILLLIYWMLQDYVHVSDVHKTIIKERQTVVVVDSMPKAEKLKTLIALLEEDKCLTAKETEILGELVEGKSRKEIALIHHISENTVKTHVTHIYEKFKVSSRDALLSLLHKE